MIHDDDLENVFKSLAAAFPDDRIHWRLGATNQRSNGGKPSKGVALAYIDARDVMERLDAVVGPANWQNRYTQAEQKTVCEIGIRINGEWVWKADGAGDTDYEANKGAMSDAFKRAAVRWGVGQYLYTIPTLWVDCTERGQIEEKELKRLQGVHSKAAQVVDWGTKADQNTYRLLLSTLKTFATEEADVRQWMEDNKGTMSGLPTLMKKALWEEIQRLICDLNTEAAA